MAGRQVGVDIKAKTSGTEDVDKLNKSLEKLPDKPVELEVTAKPNPAIDRVLDKLTALDEQARATAVAAEALGEVLGPELAARADMTSVVNELKRTGLTLEEITANAGELGAKLKSIDSDDLGGRMGKALGTARGEFEKTSDAARGATSATANMFGNVAGEASNLFGIMGPLNVSLGQFVEYGSEAALEGQGLGSVLKDMAGSVGPVAALALGMQLLGDAMNAAKESRAFDAANVEQYVDALKDGTSAVQSFNDEIRETGELSYRTQHGGGFLGMFSSTQDLLPVLEKAAIDVAQFNKIVEDYQRTQDFSGEANDRWRKSLEAAGVAQLDAIEIVKAARQEAAARIEANEKDRRVTDLLGESEAQRAERLRESAEAEAARLGAMDAATNAAHIRNEAEQESADMLERVNGLLDEQAAKLNAQVDAGKGYADAVRAENDAMAAFADTLKSSTATTDDQVDAAIRLAEAHAATAAATAEADGVTQTATAKVDTFNDALLTTAGTLNGPARQAVANYIADVNRVPPEKRTDFLAAVAAGDLATARALLDGVSVTRTAAIQADATNTAQTSSELDAIAAKKRIAYIDAQLRGQQNIPGTVAPAPYALPPGDTPPGVMPAAAAAPAPAAGYTPASTAGVFVVEVPVQPSVTVNVRADAIGSTFDVQRAVARAARGSVRLSGSRP